MDGASAKQDGLWENKSSSDISSCPEASLETVGSLAQLPDQQDTAQDGSVEVNRVFKEEGSPDRSSQVPICQNGQIPDLQLSLDPTTSPVGPDASTGSTASSLPLEKEEQVRLQARKRLEEQLMQYRVKRHRERCVHGELFC